MNVENRFSISEERRDDDTVKLTVEGEINVQTSSQLKKSIAGCIATGVKQLHIALDGAERIDSSGVATLVEGLKWSRSSGGRFVISGLQEEVRDLIRLSKLENEFEIVDADS